MHLTVKLKNSIRTYLEKVKHDTFDERDIKMLLIDVRDLIESKNLLYELANFVAHPTDRRQAC